MEGPLHIRTCSRHRFDTLRLAPSLVPYLWPLSELEEYGEVNGDDDGEGEQELREAGDHGVGHLPLALPRVLPPVSPGLPCCILALPPSLPCAEEEGQKMHVNMAALPGTRGCLTG